MEKKMRFPIWLAAGAFLTGSIAVVALPAVAQAAGECLKKMKD